MDFSSGVQTLLGGINVGTREQRSRLQEVLQSFFSGQGYAAEFGSFSNGRLLIHAAPAEHALLRYDLPALRNYLDQSDLGEVVDDIKVKTRTITA